MSIELEYIQQQYQELWPTSSRNTYGIHKEIEREFNNRGLNAIDFDNAAEAYRKSDKWDRGPAWRNLEKYVTSKIMITEEKQTGGYTPGNFYIADNQKYCEFMELYTLSPFLPENMGKYDLCTFRQELIKKYNLPTYEQFNTFSQRWERRIKDHANLKEAANILLRNVSIKDLPLAQKFLEKQGWIDPSEIKSEKKEEQAEQTEQAEQAVLDFPDNDIPF